MLPYKVCLQGFYFANINLILHTQITQMDVYILRSEFGKWAPTVQALIKKSEGLRTTGVLSQLVIHCVWSSDLSWGQQQSEGPSPHWLSKLLCTIRLMLIYCNFFPPVWSFILLLVYPFTGPRLHILLANWTEMYTNYCLITA